MRSFHALVAGAAFLALCPANASPADDIHDSVEQARSVMTWSMTVMAGIGVYILVTLLTFVIITMRRSRDRERVANEKLEIANKALSMALDEVRERADAEIRANMLAGQDTLTGLPNRRHMHERLTSWITSGRGPCTTMLLDLDRFKAVNDMNGHQTGDAVLLEVSRRLGNVETGVESFVVRLGGDEFVMVLMGTCDENRCRRIADDIIGTIGAPYDIDDRKHSLGTSIGIARFPQDGDNVEQMIRAADVAMYEAKRSGRNTYRFYDCSLDQRMRERTLLEEDLRQAVRDQKIETWFQPIVALSSGRIHGFEALARWNHPGRGMVPPDVFIPIAEEIGMIEQVTIQVMQQACRAAREWPEGIRVSVNMSPVMFRDSWIVAKTFTILQQERLRPDRLVIEITENAVIDDLDFARSAVDAFRKAGISIALDDFGCGYSSLSTLKELAFDNLKLDSSFARTIGRGDSLKITNAVSGLARAMGMTATAEGVESREIADILLDLGFDYGQGYLYGRAASAEETLRIAMDSTKDMMLQVA